MKVKVAGSWVLSAGEVGGRERQVGSTIAALTAIGVDAAPFDWLNDRVDGDSVFHIIGMDEPLCMLGLEASALGAPVVVSPVYYPMRSPLVMSVLNAIAPASHHLHHKLGLQRALLTKCREIVANTHEEAAVVQALFHLRRSVRVIPHGFDGEQFLVATEDLVRSAFRLPDEFLLYVGRIEPRKNLLMLVESSAQLQIPLAMIGAVTERYRAYGAEVLRRLDNAGGIYLGPVSDRSMLASAFAAARVFALVSFCETPGFAALEAAAAGANVVVTKVGGAREYLGSGAFYVDPHSKGDVTAKLREAWESPRDGTAKAELLSLTNPWSHTASVLRDLYSSCLG